MADRASKQITEKLDAIIRLLAIQAAHGKSKKEAILLLGAAGLDRNTIADLLDSTPLAVSVTQSEARKAKKKAKKQAPNKKRTKRKANKVSPESSQ